MLKVRSKRAIAPIFAAVILSMNVSTAHAQSKFWTQTVPGWISAILEVGGQIQTFVDTLVGGGNVEVSQTVSSIQECFDLLGQVRDLFPNVDLALSYNSDSKLCIIQSE